MNIKNIYCVQCEKKSPSRAATGRDIYPLRPALWHKKFYICLTCGNYIGVHAKTGVPLGSIPTPELRKKRREIHSILDPIWQKGRVNRRELYRVISERIGRRYHTAKINSIGEADYVLNVIKQMAREEGIKI